MPGETLPSRMIEGSQAPVPRPMKILFLLPFDPTSPKGNSIAAKRLAEGFAGKGHHIRFLAAEHAKTPDEFFFPLGAEGDRLPDICLVMHAWRCANDMQRLHQVMPHLPVIVSLRGTDLNEMLDAPDTGPTIADVLQASQGIVVFHAEGREKLRRSSPEWSEKTRVITNSASLPHSDIDYRQRLHLNPAIDPKAFLFLMVAGLRAVKQPTRVLPWLEELLNAGHHLALIHVGPPLEAQTTQDFAAFATTRPWIHHFDQIPHEEIDSFLRIGNAFISASRSEGMPHAVYEAMLSGLPLLLSDIEGHRLMAAGKTEALFFSDREDFLAAAHRLMSDRSLCRRLGESARQRAQTALATTNEIDAYLDFFQEVLRKPQP